ncbi:Hypothetical predicted protein [Mytilus galloprovincialis]|uniref:C3H1-type domain-containing protein n=1 Tax=Mytilus galloprovincialis TaxID=29158 RepID=A0A8B6G4Y3_MYTGA|nr:Hypothetical predicted protein [Mytilus galloprovincialis]
MGKTVRMSQRSYTSPYAAKKSLRSSAQYRKQASVSGSQQSDKVYCFNTNSGTEQSNSLTVDTNGQLIIQTKLSKKITDINTLIDAFLIYTSIYVGVHLEDTQNILKYMYSVKLGASRSIGLGWKVYDQQFRLKKARNPAMSWATVDQELWLLYIHTVQPNVPSYGVNMVNTNRKCYEFNNIGTCMLPQCRYIHKCLRCNGPHPAINCRVPQNEAGLRMGNF